MMQRFRRDERASSAVEFALLLPLLLAVLLGTVTLFDLFRNQQNLEKATFTVGDVLSRQTTTNQTFIDSMTTLVRKLVPTASDAGLRISSISNRGGTLSLDWSRVSGDSTAIDPAIPYEVVPDIAAGDSVILTETFVPHRAMIAGFGVDELTFKFRAVHRPRFVSAVAYH